jgi:glycerol-3-phosphate dehydrogenase (NAD+)
VAATQGKPAAIARIRQRNPYNTVVMIGDGITDLEAVQVSGGADLFIGFGGVVERPAVAAEADWYIHAYSQLVNALKRYKVGVVVRGSFRLLREG